MKGRDWDFRVPWKLAVVLECGWDCEGPGCSQRKRETLGKAINMTNREEGGTQTNEVFWGECERQEASQAGAAMFGVQEGGFLEGAGTVRVGPTEWWRGDDYERSSGLWWLEDTQEGEWSRNLSCVRSGHESASTDTIFTTFLAKSRKRTGVKEQKTMGILRNNIWYSSRTSENLLPDKMMF